MSWASTDRLTEPPTMISAGDADTPSTCGQTLSVPLTRTVPARGVSWQRRWTATGVVAWAATSNVAEPPQATWPFVDVAVSAIENPVPAGSGPMTADTVVL